MDPFEVALAEAAEKAAEKAKQKPASKTVAKKKSRGTDADQSGDVVTSTPAAKQKKGAPASRQAASNESVVLEKVVRTSKDKSKKSATSGKKKKSSSRPAKKNSPPPQTETASEAGTESEDEEDPEDGEVELASARKRVRKNSFSGSSDSGNDARRLLEGLMSLTKKRKKNKKKSKKRSRSSSSSSASSSDPEDEEVVLTDKQLRLRDNGEDILDMNTRHLLRTPTSSLDVWWKAPFRSRVSRPIRGSGLNMEPSIGHARIHDTTVRRCHDRCATLTVKMLLSKNADVSIRDSKVMKISGDKVCL